MSNVIFAHFFIKKYKIILIITETLSFIYNSNVSEFNKLNPTQKYKTQNIFLKHINLN